MQFQFNYQLDVNFEPTGGNLWVVPEGSHLATGYFAERDIPYNLCVFATTAHAYGETNVLEYLLAEENRSAAVAALVAAAELYSGLTVDFEGLYSESRRQDFSDFMAYDVTCRLVYGRQIDGGTANKYVTVDAKTGELKSLSSGRYYQEKWPDSIPASVSAAAAQTTAQKALSSFAGTNYAKLGLAETENAKDEAQSWQHVFTFQQTANGYFYDGNAYTVAVDATDGTLSALRGSFDEQVELATPAKRSEEHTSELQSR